MNKIKNVMIVFFVLSLVVFLSACNKNSSDPQDTGNNSLDISNDTLMGDVHGPGGAVPVKPLTECKTYLDCEEGAACVDGLCQYRYE